MHSFRYQNVLIFPLYILRTRRFDTFCSRQFDQHSLEHQQYSQIFLELYLFMNKYLCQTEPKYSFYILPKVLTWLAQFCVITYPNLYISDLVYATRSSSIFRLNIYKNRQNVTILLTFTHEFKSGKTWNCFHTLTTFVTNLEYKSC